MLRKFLQTLVEKNAIRHYEEGHTTPLELIIVKSDEQRKLRILSAVVARKRRIQKLLAGNTLEPTLWTRDDFDHAERALRQLEFCREDLAFLCSKYFESPKEND